MSRLALRKIICVTGALLAAAPLASVQAATTVVTGNHDIYEPFFTYIDPSQDYVPIHSSRYFTLDFGDAPITNIFMNEIDDVLISSFYVYDEVADEFFVGTGDTPVNLQCIISAGGSCTDGATIDGGFVEIAIMEMNGLISGSQTLGGFYNDCFAEGVVPVDGAICGVDSFLYSAFLEVDFDFPDEAGVFYPYTLTISDEPITGSVPEPATWTMLLIGFGAIGAGVRRQRARVRFAFA